jgi:5-methylcytosine-specific restriction endonuclease McrA
MRLTDEIQFETHWYILSNLIGFRNINTNFEYDKKSDKVIRFKKHRRSSEARYDLLRIFTDYFDDQDLHEPKRPIRIAKPPDKVPKKCARCGKRSKRLQIDHVLALSRGGKDEPFNLQYLCPICHKFKTAEDNILSVLANQFIPNWKRNLWNCRLETLRKLNPIGAKEYTSYFVDPKTHHGYRYERTKQVKSNDEDANIIKLEAFITK